MSTGVIITGQMRTFAQIWANQYWMVYRKLKDPYFFVSIAKDEDADSVKLLEQRFPKEKIFVEYVTQPTLPEPKEELNHGAYPRSAKVQGVLRQLWALNRGWDFFTEAKGDGVEIKEVVRIRPDLHFHSFELPPVWDLYPNVCFSPWWSRWGGVNDRFAILGSLLTAKHYFTAFQSLDQMLKDGAPLHPESLIAEALARHQIVSSHLKAYFTTVRKDGTQIPPDAMINDLADISIP